MRRKHHTTLLGGLIGLFWSVGLAPLTHAAVDTFMTDPLPVNTTASSDFQGPHPVYDDCPDIATDGQGTWIVVWDQFNELQGVVYEYHTAFARSTNNGVTWSPPAYLASDADSCPRVAAFGQGVWGVVWANGGHSFGPSTVLFARSTDNGVTWSAPIVLDATPYSRDPFLAADALGNLTATWRRGQDRIVVARSADRGATWGAAVELATLGNASGAPRAAVADNGASVVMWVCENGPQRQGTCLSTGFLGECSSTGRHCRASGDCSEDESCILSGSVSCSTVPPGTPCCPGTIEQGYCWTPYEHLDAATALRDINPNVVTDNRGNWIATWWAGESAIYWRGSIVVATSADDGRTWTAPYAIFSVRNPPLRPSVSQPEIATDGSGNWVVTWDSTVDPHGNSQNDGDVLFSRSTDNGQTWSTPDFLNTNARKDRPSGDDYWPRLATDRSGRWMATWASWDDFDGQLTDPDDGAHQENDALFASFFLSNLRLVEPEPFQLHGPDLTTDELKLMVFGHERWGLTADGVTRLLVRVPVPGPGAVQFSISDEEGGTSGVGSLYAPGSSTESTVLPVPVSQPLPGRFWAFAVLRAPEDFVRSPLDEPSTFRPIELTAEYSPTGGGPHLTFNREVRLVRPPVILLHGLWSDENTWVDPDHLSPLLTDARFTIYRHDYSRTHADAFAANVPEVRKAVDHALGLMRDTGVAATQVDDVGHSMGGLISRLYAANATGDYVRDTNYGAGDINRLITLDTPHFGSPLADILHAIAGTPGHESAIAAMLRSADKCLTCGAVDDLMCDSPPISQLPAASLPAHAITATGGSDVQLVLERGLQETLIYQLLDFTGYGLSDVFFPEAFHDGIVGLVSQRGGLSISRTSPFGWASTSEQGVHTSVPKEERISTEIVRLLNIVVNDSSTFASGFPANTGIPATCPYSRTAARSLNLTTTGGISITQPSAGDSVNPGQAIAVTVEGFGGYVPARVMIVGGGDSVIVDQPPFTATITVAPDRSAPTVFSALAVDASGAYAVADTVQIATLQTAFLQDISVDNTPLTLTSYAPSQQLRISGRYADGINRDVTAAARGTTYVSQNPSIATVDSEGRVTAKSLGTVAVDARNTGLFAQAIVVVESLPLTLLVSRDGASWPPSAGAVGYDVVRGDLDLLRSSGGDFAASTSACVSDNASGTAITDTTVPGAGEGLWYLVRFVYADAGATGSYGENGTGGARDTGIANAANACP